MPSRGGGRRVVSAKKTLQYRLVDMCGRFTLHTRDRIRLKGLPVLELPFEPHYNIAPSQNVVAVGDFGNGLEIADLTWGLIPSWSAQAKAFINARAETLEDKPSFSDSFRLRRCLIPADGFFEPCGGE